MDDGHYCDAEARGPANNGGGGGGWDAAVCELLDAGVAVGAFLFKHFVDAPHRAKPIGSVTDYWGSLTITVAQQVRRSATTVVCCPQNGAGRDDRCAQKI